MTKKTPARKVSKGGNTHKVHKPKPKPKSGGDPAAKPEPAVAEVVAEVALAPIAKVIAAPVQETDLKSKPHLPPLQEWKPKPKTAEKNAPISKSEPAPVQEKKPNPKPKTGSAAKPVVAVAVAPADSAAPILKLELAPVQEKKSNPKPKTGPAVKTTVSKVVAKNGAAPISPVALISKSEPAPVTETKLNPELTASVQELKSKLKVETASATAPALILKPKSKRQNSISISQVEKSPPVVEEIKLEPKPKPKPQPIIPVKTPASPPAAIPDELAPAVAPKTKMQPFEGCESPDITEPQIVEVKTPAASAPTFSFDSNVLMQSPAKKVEPSPSPAPSSTISVSSDPQEKTKEEEKKVNEGNNKWEHGVANSCGEPAVTSEPETQSCSNPSTATATSARIKGNRVQQTSQTCCTLC